MKKKNENIRTEKKNNIYNEFYKAVEDLIEHPAVLEMKNYPHHCDTSCYQHCLNVAYYNFKICKAFGLDAKAAARAGMVHDLFLYDWRLHAELTKDRFHAMTHPKVALKNAKNHFELNELEQEIILKHMWPLTVVPPKSWEAFIISMTDKYCGFFEILDFYFEHHTPNWLHFPFGKIHVK